MANMSLKAFLLLSILLVTLATPPGKTPLSVHCVGPVRNKLINLLTDVSWHKGQTSARICASSFPNAELFHLGHSLASIGIILYQELVLPLTDIPSSNNLTLEGKRTLMWAALSAWRRLNYVNKNSNLKDKVSLKLSAAYLSLAKGVRNLWYTCHR